MKRTIFLLLIVGSSFSLSAQATQEDFSDYFNKVNEQIKTLRENHDYEQIIKLLSAVENEYHSLNNKKQEQYQFMIDNVYYNLACYYSLTDKKDSAISYLQKAIDNGYNGYYWFLKDNDLDNLRNESAYDKIVAQLREVGDYKYILKQYPNYSTSQSTEELIPSFTYQSPKDSGLVSLRDKYKLDSIAGDGDEISKIINLMRWTHNIVKHDGNITNPKDKKADAIIQLCQSEQRGVNCRMIATILNEVYLAMGFSSRFVTCMPKPQNFMDCHVINIVFSKTLNKWLWMDPSFEAYVMDDKGNLLSIAEVRERLINDEPLQVAESLNWNGGPYSGGAQRYLHEYMAKNLFRFSCPLESRAGFESSGSNRIYIELFPAGYNPEKVEFGVETEINYGHVYYTIDDSIFWAKPGE